MVGGQLVIESVESTGKCKRCGSGGANLFIGHGKCQCNGWDNVARIRVDIHVLSNLLSFLLCFDFFNNVHLFWLV